MIEHIYIKNYKAFARTNIPIQKHTMLVGTNNSGKTTVLDALDLFFNDTFHHEYVQNKTNDVVIELHINDERYRKVYKAPTFNIDYDQCIGDMFDINKIQFLYVKQDPDYKQLLNQMVTINVNKEYDSDFRRKAIKIMDYIDGIRGNTLYPLFSAKTNIKMNIKGTFSIAKKELLVMLSNITHPKTIVGIDVIEAHLDVTKISNLMQHSYQTIFTSNEEQVVSGFEYFVHALYKEDIKDEIDTVYKQVKPKKKRVLLVEGKYDVAWYEKALELLDKDNEFRVIPCGGAGNIRYVKHQLDKEDFDTIAITDGDVEYAHSLKREVIEQYVDLDFFNKAFRLELTSIPSSKKELFSVTSVKDDVVKQILSQWARKHLTKDNPLIKEIQEIIS